MITAMDAYPDDYVDHNLPLLLVSGLDEGHHDVQSSEGAKSLLQEGGFRLRTDLPALQGQRPSKLLRTLLDNDASKTPWSGKYVSQAENKSRFRIRSIGRSFTLPPRKAPPPPHSPRMLPAGGGASPPPPMILHSMLSPLTPSSPLYADGIMTSLWIAKHQSRLPSAFVSVFSLSSDPNTHTLLDNKIKSEISNIRNVFASANYKTKLVVVLLGDEGLSLADTEERVANIRRATALDNKSLFSLPGSASLSEIEDFVTTMLNAIYPISIEYYRDLSKHARRKRNRNVIPQPTVLPPSGSHVLSIQAWNVRYELKLGIFAEFRQEMDAALRNYETAYENLSKPDVLNAIPAWSLRFDEARLLSDVIAFRIIRCLLWTGQTTNAVKWWTDHRDRSKDLVTRRGGGTETYAWETWQSVWAKAMADLISRTQILPETDFAQTESVEKSILVHSEKTLPTSDRFAPWESLHHEGYWLNLAQRHTRARRSRAKMIPQEDRAPPGQSPASAIANRSHLYDRYMSLEPHKEYPASGQPGYDYTNDIINTLNAAIQHFSRHSQIRMVHVLQLQQAMELMKSSLWAEAVNVLTPLWQDPRLRTAGWWLILREVCRALWACAVRSQDYQLLMQMEWERIHPLIWSDDEKQSDSSDGLAGLAPADRTDIVHNVRGRLSNLSAKVAFATAECHVGQNINVQISLQYLGSDTAGGIRLDKVKVAFQGPLMPICITDVHSKTDEQSLVESDSIVELDLVESQSTDHTNNQAISGDQLHCLLAEADLSLRSGNHKILQFQINPSEAGNASATSITLDFAKNDSNVSIFISHEDIVSATWWELRKERALGRRFGKDREVVALTVLPKPPKLEISVADLKKVYYTNEDVDLQIKLTNQENDVINGSVDTRLISPSKNTASIKWKDQIETPAKLADSTELVQVLSQRQLTEMEVNKEMTLDLRVDSITEAVDHELEIVATYSLPSNPLTLLHKQLTIDLAIVRPFEANFGFHSRLHEDPWPCFFSADSISKDKAQPSGLKQRFLVSALVCSFAVEDVIIKEARLITPKIVGDAICTTSKGYLQDHGTEGQAETIAMRPEQNSRFAFEMVLQKHTLGDRQPAAVDFALEIIWKRKSATDEPYHTSMLQAPRFLAPSSEPRVLLQVHPPTTLGAYAMKTYHLTYTLENPSLHFLTFNLTMESSESYAFSGPKSDSISLVPISRTEVKYQIIPTRVGPSKSREEYTDQEGHEWTKVHLDVVDAYFGQTLRVQPASDGVRVDKQGNVLIRIH